MQQSRTVRALARPFSMALAVALTAALALTLTACSANPQDTRLGPPGEQPAFAGISVTSMDHSVAVRDLLIPDPGPNGYPAGTNVALVMQVWNNTNAPVSLTGASVVGGSAATLNDAKSSATPSATTFNLPIAAGKNIPLNQTSGQFLEVRCASRTLASGTDLPMTFAFSNGATIAVNVPIGQIPASPSAAAGGC